MIKNKIVFSCFSFLCFAFIFFAISCAKNEKSIGKQNFKTILSAFIGKTPNQLYVALGKPDAYKIVYNKKGAILKAKASYNYVFNFLTRQYDCTIDFITDKSQQKIVDYEYNSEQCFYMTMY